MITKHLALAKQVKELLNLTLADFDDKKMTELLSKVRALNENWHLSQSDTSKYKEHLWRFWQKEN